MGIGMRYLVRWRVAGKEGVFLSVSDLLYPPADSSIIASVKPDVAAWQESVREISAYLHFITTFFVRRSE